MGNISSFECSKPERAQALLLEQHWTPDAAWRSHRSIDLDVAHPQGLSRPPLKLGESFSIIKAANEAKNAKPRIHVQGMRFHTDARVLERQAMEDWHTKKSEEEKAAATNRNKAAVLVGQPIAPWRVAIHAARRRALLKVLALVRLVLAVRAPRNLAVRNLAGHYVPLALRESLGVFAQVQRLYLAILKEVDILKAALYEARAALQAIGSGGAGAAAAAAALPIAGPNARRLSTPTTSHLQRVSHDKLPARGYGSMSGSQVSFGRRRVTESGDASIGGAPSSRGAGSWDSMSLMSQSQSQSGRLPSMERLRRGSQMRSSFSGSMGLTGVRGVAALSAARSASESGASVPPSLSSVLSGGSWHPLLHALHCPQPTFERWGSDDVTDRFGDGSSVADLNAVSAVGHGSHPSSRMSSLAISIPSAPPSVAASRLSGADKTSRPRAPATPPPRLTPHPPPSVRSPASDPLVTHARLGSHAGSGHGPRSGASSAAEVHLGGEGSSRDTLASRLGSLRARMSGDGVGPTSAGSAFIAAADKRRRSSTLLVNSTASPQSLMNPHQAPGPASGPAAAPSTATTAANIARAVLGVPRVGGSGRLALGSVTRGENGANGSMSGPTPPSSSPTQPSPRAAGAHTQAAPTSKAHTNRTASNPQVVLGMPDPSHRAHLSALESGRVPDMDVDVPPDRLEAEAHAKVASAMLLPAGQRVTALARAVEEAGARLGAAQHALEAAIARSNTEWADRHEWDAPSVDDTPSRPAWQETESYAVYAAQAVRLLQLGKIAVVVFAEEDWVGGGTEGEATDLWTADPWLVMAGAGTHSADPAHTPATTTTGSTDATATITATAPSAPAPPARRSLSYGTRVLLALVSAVERLTGAPDAVSSLTVVLHVTDAQREQVLADMHEVGAVYARLRGRLLLVQHECHHGYCFDPDQKAFVPDPDSPLGPLGSGLSVMQLGWSGEALSVGDDGALRAEGAPALEVMAARGVEWVTAWRARDAALITGEAVNVAPAAGAGVAGVAGIGAKGGAPSHNGPLDLSMLAYCLYMRDTHRINAMVQAVRVDSWESAARFDSLLMEPRVRDLGASRDASGPPSNASGAGGAGGGDGGDVMSQLAAVQSKHRKAQLRKVCEIKMCETASEHMAGQVVGTQTKAGTYTGLCTGVSRYVFHLPALASILTSVMRFRPKLALRDGLVRVTVDLSDLTAHTRCRMLAVHAHEVPALLRTPSDLAHPSVVAALTAQDTALAAAEARHSSASKIFRPVKVQHTPRHAMVVLVADNAVADTAAAAAAMVARPGIDKVHLVHVAPPNAVAVTAPGAEVGHALLGRVAAVVSRRGLTPVTHAVPRSPGQGLLEAVGEVLGKLGCTLLVMGSIKAVEDTGTHSQGGHSRESFSLMCVRRFSLPTLLVTPFCKIPPSMYAPPPGSGPTPVAPPTPSTPTAPTATTTSDGTPAPRGLTTLVSVEPHARPLMYYLCALLSPQQRGDRLLMGQVIPPKGSPPAFTASMAAVADRFRDIARNHDVFEAAPLPLEAPLPRALVASVKASGVNLIAMQMPSTVALASAYASTAALSPSPASGQAPQPPPLVLGSSRHVGFPPHMLSVLRGAGVPLLVYPDRHVDIGQASGPQHVVMQLNVRGSIHF